MLSPANLMTKMGQPQISLKHTWQVQPAPFSNKQMLI